MKNYILYYFVFIFLFSTSTCVLSNDELLFSCVANVGKLELYKNNNDYRLAIVSSDSDLNSLVGICSKGKVRKISYHRFKVVEHSVSCSIENDQVEFYHYISEEEHPFKEQGVLIKGMEKPYICVEGSFSKINNIDDTK